MKNQTTYCLCLTASLYISSCKPKDSTGTAHKPSPQNQAKIYPLTSNNDKVPSVSIRSILKVIPVKAFEFTSDGITHEELKMLTHKLESPNWKVILGGENHLSIEAKQPSAQISMHSYSIGANAVVVCHTINERASSMETWLYDSASRTVSKKQFLPVVSINDFYAKSDKVAEPQKYISNVTTSIDKNGTLTYDLSTWMEPALINKKKVNIIAATWDGEKFKKKVSPVPSEER